MNLAHRHWFLIGALGASAVTLYAWIARFLITQDASLEAQAFTTHPWIFILYALGICTALISGPAALEKGISSKSRPSNIFCLACLTSAWSGVLLTHAVGPNGLGGVTLQFYWWGLAAVWTTLIAGIYLFAGQSRWLAMRDWTVYAYALAWLPAIIFITYPLWLSGMQMSSDEAIVTAAFMPFAGLFVLAHWYIVEIIDERQ